MLTWRKCSSIPLRLLLGVCLILLCAMLLWYRISPASSSESPELSRNELQNQQNQISWTCIHQEQDYSQNDYQVNLKSDSKITLCGLGYVPHRGGDGNCILCPHGKFSLSNWIACEPLLDCEHVRHEITKGQLLHSLFQWRYFKADWKGYEIIYASFNPMAKTSIDYSHIQSFSPSYNFLYPIGFCEEEKIILFALNTTYIDSGNHLDVLFSKKPACNTCMVRFHLVLSYVHILSQLHAMDIVLCNSRSLDHLLSQFLISEDFALVLATLDNLQSDASGPILCHSSEETGNFVAPEQKWLYGSDKIFNVKEQPKYDKMSDIWKVPEVASFFLKDSCDDVLDYLQAVHSRCKSVSPYERPSIEQLLLDYESVWKLLFSPMM